MKCVETVEVLTNPPELAQAAYQDRLEFKLVLWITFQALSEAALPKAVQWLLTSHQKMIHARILLRFRRASPLIRCLRIARYEFAGS